MTRCLQEVFSEVISRVEWSLGRTLGNPRLRILPSAIVGGLACAVDDEITLARETLLLPPAAVYGILAHEAVHVAQKRLRRPSRRPGNADPAHVRRVEREATLAAAALLQGQRVHCAVADAPRRVAFWGELGHYYTCYYVMLMAGVPPIAAHTRAFFCQLPDEVWEFDAIAATLDHAFAAPHETDASPLGQHLVSWQAGQRSTPGVVCGSSPATCRDESEGFHYIKRTEWRDPGQGTARDHMLRQVTVTYEDPQTKSRRLKRNLDVIHGLHCLTGGNDSAAETRRRRRRVVMNWNNLIVSGLALHAFGDSFAHRDLHDSNRFYQGSTNASVHSGHLRDGHHPDYVASHAGQYDEYCMALYDLVCECQRVKRTPEATTALQKQLHSLTTPRTTTTARFNRRLGDSYEIKRPATSAEVEDLATTDIKQMIESKLARRLKYTPEKNDALHWKEFATTHQEFLKSVGGDPRDHAWSVKKQIIDRAALWGREAE